MKKNDEFYMQRAFNLAALAKDEDVLINPKVGAVYVKNNVILAEGYHKGFGQLHAEYNALKDQPISVEGATVYVTLEPCAHDDLYPACTKLLIEKKVARVVIASFDPNPIEDGDGVAALAAAGIAITTGVLEEKNKVLNAHYFARF
jgi:diaminohydroxyphosphoribosylaminopyrimidine deaminase/5-amino-6-(5-phosphoribosylamino)uracil reductase